MAVNKNFVVKNGLEVSTDLIFASANTNKVGIASTGPRTELDVRGGIAATDISITGVGTFASVDINAGDIEVSNVDTTNLNVTGFGTVNALQVTDLNVTGVTTFVDITLDDITARNLYLSGIATIPLGSVTNLQSTNVSISGVSTIPVILGITTIASIDSTNVNVSGIGTFNNIDINDGDVEVTSVRTSNLNATGVTTIASLSVTGSTFETLTVNQYTNLLGVTTIANVTGTNLNFSGVSTFATVDINGGDLEVANLDATDINVTGVSTLGTFKISSGIITATSGIVTYYGDGSKLANIVSGVGISSLGTLIGTGATILNFVGTALSTVTVSSGIATIKLDAGIGLTPGGSDGQVQYNNAGVFAGSSNFTFDGSNVNIAGVVTATDFNSTSDKNLKTNIKTVDNALSIVSSLRGVSFDWKESGNGSYGVIAQELEKILPDLVTKTDPKTVNYNGIIGVLIEAIKELREELQSININK